MCPSYSVSRLSCERRKTVSRSPYIYIICDNSSRSICIHDSQPIAIDKGSLVHGFIYRSVSGVALWQRALPLIRCRLGFYLSFIFLYTHTNGTVFKRKPSSRKVNSNHRKSGAFLDVPPGENKKLTEPEDPENSYRLRSFSFTSKGIVNRGDSFRKRRSRSNSLAREDDPKECTPPNSYDNNSQQVQQQHQFEHQQQQQYRQNECGDDITSHTVSLMGSRGVGKTTLISQFMTSEYINAYERQKDNYESSVQSVCIMLNGEESELRFINDGEVSTKEDRLAGSKIADAYLVIFSVVDKNSFETAETILKNLREHEMLRSRPAILVGNKVDMARSREVTAQVSGSIWIDLDQINAVPIVIKFWSKTQRAFAIETFFFKLTISHRIISHEITVRSSLPVVGIANKAVSPPFFQFEPTTEKVTVRTHNIQVRISVIAYCKGNTIVNGIIIMPVSLQLMEEFIKKKLYKRQVHKKDYGDRKHSEEMS
ncbi:hypothetical protein QTP88_005126 [Uroleucon formosanum]